MSLFRKVAEGLQCAEEGGLGLRIKARRDGKEALQIGFLLPGRPVRDGGVLGAGELMRERTDSKKSEI